MKIESLEFKNINSLKGEHVIDFDKSPLNSGGLFAIIGPTGSGKSTLLDAICLALYGRTPRISSVTKNKIEQDGSILTKHQKDAYAKVKFSCKSGIFISTWSISTNRNGKLREHDMDLWDPKTEKHFSEKKTENLEEIQRLIGLSYDQFVKSVLLSQGEFATLLKSNEKERSELLEKITNTSIYRQIGRKVYEKYNQLKSKISDQKNILENLEKKLLSQEDLKEKEFEKQRLESEDKEKEIKLAKFEKDLDLIIQKEKRQKEFETESKKLEKFQNEFDAFQNEHAKKLSLHAKTLDFEEELLEHNALVEKKENQIESIENLNTDYNQLLVEIKDSKYKIQELLKSEIKDTEVENQLDELLRHYRKLDSERQIKRNEFSNKKDNLNKELSALHLSYKNQPITKFKSQLKENLVSSEQKISSLDIQVKDEKTLEEKIKTQQHHLNLIKDAKYDDKTIADLEERFKSLETQVKNEKEALLKFPKLISEQKVLLENLEKELKHLETQKENQQLKLQVEDLRKKLAKNEPCPVCGALDHPYSEHDPIQDTDLDKKIRDQKRELQMASEELAKLNAEENSKRKHLQNDEEELKSIKLNIQKKKEHFQKNYELLLKDLSNRTLAELEVATEQKIKKLEHLKLLLKEVAALDASISILNELEAISKLGSQLKTQMDALYEGDDLENFVSILKKEWNNLNSKLSSTSKSLDKEKGNLEITKNKFVQLQENLGPKIKSSEFSSISEANSSRMKAADYQALSQQLNELGKRLDVQKERITNLKSEIEKIEIEAFADQAEAKEAIDLLRKNLVNIKKKLEDVKRVLDNDRDHLLEFKKIEESISKEQKANKKWELLNKLIGDATGSEFNKFAQDLSLQRLIHLGNKRLKHLNDRYELDRYLPGEDKDQLYVIDNYMGGLRRSVKTLSGGETFLMSLALALGLSDLASRNVEINSLFIDEGFGTLDPETLDMTLDTLERLQEESNKTIGIISHVSTLKERIQTQIVLNRNAQGYSQLEVNG